eukprot:SAG31_NODE_328_length_17643_cov_46.707649_9_plen_109_part_00
MNVKGSAGKKVSDVVDQEYVKALESGGHVELIRYIKPWDYVLTEDDANAAAGTTMLQIWITTDTHEEAAAKEMGMRKNLYKIKQNDQYPPFWVELAAKNTAPLGVFSA